VDIVLKYEGVWQVLFSAELFRKSTVIFPEISGKIPPEISGNFRTHNPTHKTGTQNQHFTVEMSSMCPPAVALTPDDDAIHRRSYRRVDERLRQFLHASTIAQFSPSTETKLWRW